MNLYVANVDLYRRPSRRRNTRGLYLVIASNAKKARSIVQKAIGFGSILIHTAAPCDNIEELSRYGKVFRIKENHLYEPKHATDSQKTGDDIPIGIYKRTYCFQDLFKDEFEREYSKNRSYRFIPAK